MAVYVDAEEIKWRGREWSHLVADSLDELHAFADRLGLRRSWFQSKTLYPHYDVTKSVRTRALAMGAHGVDREKIVIYARQMRSEMIQAHRDALCGI
ncbi:DUF4031 domain-containing protein [Pseudomonas sp. P5_109]|uniref:DUF4031 domain-containing protein n=1 Tax=Pseudomonas sp. P5_109 TaxID=3043441 RepID=UPI002A36B4AE|nr:DUF4031 domain-containing protein [Pseudomonas sp. P5_109]WPN29891.1 DUF4031 domain-containing protein [Pseudomonas sp. P5_109]